MIASSLDQRLLILLEPYINANPTEEKYDSLKAVINKTLSKIISMLLKLL